MGRALGEDDLERAGAELDALARRLGQMQEAQRRQASRALGRAERSLGRDRQPGTSSPSDPTRRALERLRRDLEQASRDLGHDAAARANSLEQAGRSLDQMARELSRLARLQRITARLLEMKTMVAGKGKPDAKKQRLREFMARTGGGRPDLLLPGEGDTPLLALGQETARASGSDPGDSHEPLRLDSPAPKAGRHHDVAVSGRKTEGPSRAEVILAASERGFASLPYRRVWSDYSNVVEESLTHEDVPPGQRRYVRRYFDLIRPRR